jgi:hypothetical protein
MGTPRRFEAMLLTALLCACGASAPPPAKPVTAKAAPATGQRTVMGNTDLIRVDAPQCGALVGKSLHVTGAARGGWYFEATFPVRLLDERGETLAAGVAQAQGEWMTEAYVPFSAELKLTAAEGGNGTLVLERNNASGLPEHADELRVPVRFWPP